MAYPSVTLGGQTATGADKDILTTLRQEKGRLNAVITEQLTSSDPFLAVMSRTKEFMASYTGEVVTKVIHNINRPNEKDVLAWQRVGGASPGYNPQKVTYKEIPYGERTVTACLFQDGWKSPEFGVVDIAFKHEGAKRLMDMIDTMTQWTRDIWNYWSVQAFQHSVQCVSLNSQYGHPEALGEYPDSKPTTALTYAHCDELFMRVRDENAAMSQTVEGYQLIFIGDEEFKFLLSRYYADAATNGYSPTVASMVIPVLGKVEAIDNYMFVRNMFPRRFRDRVAGETWDDAIIPCRVQISDELGGSRTVRNPDYYNRDIAKYSETIFWNEGSVTWLVPPEAMAGGDQWFKPQNYAGDFTLFNEKTLLDPKAKNAQWFADYMSGMIAAFPKRARCVLSRYPGTQAIDVCPVGCGGTADLSEVEKFYVYGCSVPAGTTDRIQLYVSGDAIAETPPDNHSLYLVTNKGNKFLVADLISQETVTGDSIHTQGGLNVVLQVTDTELASCRTECDAWNHLAYLPSDTPVSDPTQDGCTGCSPNTVSAACTHTYTFSSVDGPVNLFDADDNDLLAADMSAGDSAATVETDIQTYLTASVSGATVEVVKDGYDWIVTITGSNAAVLVDSYITYDGGGGYPAKATVVRAGDCS